jgi:hypothetical protein
MPEISFPLRGLHKGAATSKQPGETSPDMNNVRPYDTLDNRARGGQRPGLIELYPSALGDGTKPVAIILSVSVVE